MNLADFNQQLFQLWTQQRLGHFYILLSSFWPSGEDFSSAPYPFIAQVLKGAANTLADHPDVLTVRPNAKGNYTVEDLEKQGLFSFFALKSFQGGERFVVFPQAERLGEVILNKLLKTLENPPPATTIFFQAAQENFPATIISRAAVWKATATAQGKAAQTLAFGPDVQRALRGYWQGTTKWSVVQEALKANPAAETALLAWISQVLAAYPAPNFALAQQFTADWQMALAAKKWHRPLHASFYVLLSGLRQHLPQALESLP